MIIYLAYHANIYSPKKTNFIIVLIACQNSIPPFIIPVVIDISHKWKLNISSSFQCHFRGLIPNHFDEPTKESNSHLQFPGCCIAVLRPLVWILCCLCSYLHRLSQILQNQPQFNVCQVIVFIIYLYKSQSVNTVLTRFRLNSLL